MAGAILGMAEVQPKNSVLPATRGWADMRSSLQYWQAKEVRVVCEPPRPFKVTARCWTQKKCIAKSSRGRYACSRRPPNLSQHSTRKPLTVLSLLDRQMAHAESNISLAILHCQQKKASLIGRLVKRTPTAL